MTEPLYPVAAVGRYSEGVITQFWAHVQLDGEHWLWTGPTRGAHGRAVLNVAGKEYRAARIAYAVVRRRDPHHKRISDCSVPGCICPAHWREIDSRARHPRPAPGVGAEPPTLFARLLTTHRRRWELSRHELGRRTSISPSHIGRLEVGERGNPNLDLVEALARELKITGADADAFYLAAGHVPLSVERLGGWDDLLTTVCLTLGDVRLSEGDRADFREQVLALAQLYRRVGKLTAERDRNEIAPHRLPRLGAPAANGHAAAAR